MHIRASLLALSLYCSLAGHACAADNDTPTDTIVTLKEPLYFYFGARTLDHRAYDGRYLRITTATGRGRERIGTGDGVLWLGGRRSSGLFSTETRFWPYSTIVELRLADIKTGNHFRVLTTEDAARGVTTLTSYDAGTTLICDAGVHPQANPDQCKLVASFGVSVFVEGDTVEKPEQYSVKEFIAHDGRRGMSGNHRLTRVLPASYAKKLADTALAIGQYEARKARESDEKRSALAELETRRSQLLQSAKPGTQDACSNAPAVVAATAPIASLAFECQQVGHVSMDTLRAHGWRVDHVERIPTSSVTGYSGVTVSIMITKAQTQKR